MRSRWLKVVAIAAVLGMLGGCALTGGGKKAKRKKVALPAAAADALKKAFPDALAGKAKLEDENGLKVYEVKLKPKAPKIKVEVTADGTIIEVESKIAAKDLPAAVVKAIEKAVPGATIKKAEREEVRAVVKDGKFVKLGKPKVVYEVRVVKDGKKTEIEIAADGTVIDIEQEDDDNDDHDDDDD